MITLFRDPSDHQPLEQLPMWMRSDAGSYWHIPRSAQLLPGRIVTRAWCGAHFVEMGMHNFTVRMPAELICGGCLGRHLGHDDGDRVVFRPRDHWKPPATCPGGDDGTRHCLSCGRKLRYSCRGYGGADECRHRPTEELTQRWRPCPYHGWRHVRPRGGRLVCTVSGYRSVPCQNLDLSA